MRRLLNISNTLTAANFQLVRRGKHISSSSDLFTPQLHLGTTCSGAPCRAERWPSRAKKATRRWDQLAPPETAALSDDSPFKNHKSALCIFYPCWPSHSYSQQQSSTLLSCYHHWFKLLLLWRGCCFFLPQCCDPKCFQDAFLIRKQIRFKSIYDGTKLTHLVQKEQCLFLPPSLDTADSWSTQEEKQLPTVNFYKCQLWTLGSLGGKQCLF